MYMDIHMTFRKLLVDIIKLLCRHQDTKEEVN